MRILGVTQGSNLRIFLRLAELLKEPIGLSDISLYVADSQEFHLLRPNESILTGPSSKLLKEWEIINEGLIRKPDLDSLRDWESRLGDPVLWNALIADRRIFFGRKCKYQQDYYPRFSHLQMLGVLQTAIECIQEFLNRQTPDVIIGFGISTLGDYLFYRFAKTRGIVYLQLKATKIGNYVSLNDDVISISRHVESFLNRPDRIPAESFRAAREHLASIRKKGMRYEGAINSHLRFRMLSGLVAVGRAAIRDIRNKLHPVVRTDNHVESAMRGALYSCWLQPIRAGYASLQLRKMLIRQEDLVNQAPFAFYPLHFEPEVSVQVFGRPFQNQIEVVRNLALNLPIGMNLLVKEHPRSLGFRSVGYYKKLSKIPNVRLVDPCLTTHQVIRQADLIAVISGSTGFEALVLGKPVIAFGLPTYAKLPRTMVRQISSLHELGTEIRDLLATFHAEESVLERFVAGHIAGAVAIDLYSVLLDKPGRHSEGRHSMSLEERRRQDYRALADYCVKRIVSEATRLNSDGN